MIEPGRVKKSDLKAIIAKGEDSRLQFKKDVRNVDTLASEKVPFSNGEGGRILIGVIDAVCHFGTTKKGEPQRNQPRFFNDWGEEEIRKANEDNDE